MRGPSILGGVVFLILVLGVTPVTPAPSVPKFPQIQQAVGTVASDVNNLDLIVGSFTDTTGMVHGFTFDGTTYYIGLGEGELP